MPITKINGASQIQPGTIPLSALVSGYSVPTTNLTDGTNFVKKDGSVVLTGSIDLGGTVPTNSGTPSNALDLSNKSYVDTQINKIYSNSDYVLSTKAALIAANIPSSVNSVSLLGCITSGDGGEMRCRRIGSNILGSIRSTDGTYWMPNYDKKILNIAQFGIVADANYNLSATNLVGTTVRNSGVINMASTAGYSVGMNVGDGNISRRWLRGVSITQSSNSVTGDTGLNFLSINVGALISATGIPVGTTVVSVSSDGTSMVLSNSATITGKVTFTCNQVSAIPAGATIGSINPNVSITLAGGVVCTAENNDASLISTPNYAGRIIGWSGVVSGTDNTAAWQAAIDYIQQNNISSVTCPPGNYRFDDSLHFGYGTFSTVNFIAVGKGGFAGTNPGINLYPTKTDRPFINIQGGRANVLRGVSIVGQNYLWSRFARLYANSLSLVDSDWLAPNLRATGTTPGGLQKHSPYCAVAIDPYSGVKPADAYPQQTIPAWVVPSLNGKTYYDQRFSSEFTIEDCTIIGFAAGLVCQPNSDGNGDFGRIRDSTISDCAYLVGIGNGQSRNVELRNLNLAGYHSIITGTKFGSGIGEFNGPMENWCCGYGYQIFGGIALAYMGPVTLNNFYCENQVRFGDATAGGAFIYPILVEGGIFNFTNSLHGHMPDSYLTASNDVHFTGAAFVGNQRISNLVGSNLGPISSLTFKGGHFYAAQGGAGGSTALQKAINYCGGMLLGFPRFNSSFDRSKFLAPVTATFLPTASGGLSSQLMGEDAAFGSLNRVAFTQATASFVDTQGIRWRFARPYPPTLQMTLLSNVSVPPSYAGDIITFSTAANITNGPGGYIVYKLDVGDILFHQPTGTIAVVTALGAIDGSSNQQITCIQQNNMMVNPATGAFVASTCSDYALSGYTSIIKTGFVVPKQVSYGTFTSGSTNVTSISRGDNYGADTDTYYQVGDKMFGLQYNDTAVALPIPLSCAIASITNGSPGSMTLTIAAIATGRFPISPYPMWRC